MELIGPRMMVQLKDRAAQLVKHLENADVNKEDGKQIIFQALEASPLIKQLDKHRVDEHRRRLMALNRVWGVYRVLCDEGLHLPDAPSRDGQGHGST